MNRKLLFQGMILFAMIVFAQPNAHAVGSPSARTKALALNRHKLVSVVTITATASATQVCAGQDVQLTATGGVSYTWQPGNYTGSSITVTPDSTTQFIVTGVDGFGNQGTDTVLVTVLPLPAVSIGAASTIRSTQYANSLISYSSQSGSSAAQAVGIPDVYPNYSNSPNAWTGSTADGQREFIELGFDSAQYVDIIRVYETFSPGAIDTVYLRDVSTGDWIQVYQGQTGPRPEQARIFLIYLDQTGFKADAIRLAINSPAVAGFNAIDAVSITGNTGVTTSDEFSVCQYTDVILTGSGATSFTWSPGGSTDQTISTIIAETTTFILTGEENGCFNYDTLTITLDPPPPVNVTSTSTSICSGDSVTFFYNGTHEFVWRPANSDTVHTIYPTTSTEERIVVISSGQCVTTVNYHVHVYNPNVLVTASSNPVCSNETVTLTADGSVVDFLWMPGGYTSSTVEVQLSASVTFTVTGTDENGCQDTANYSITVHDAPTVSTSADSTICQGSSVMLTASGAANYFWDTGETTNTIVVTPSATATYNVVGFSSDGCTDTAMVTITVDVCSGVNEMISEASVFPNPATGSLNISSADVISWIELSDTAGKNVRRTAVTGQALQLDISDLPAGLYILKIVYENSYASFQRVSIR